MKLIETYNELLALLAASTSETKAGIEFEGKCVNTVYLIKIDSLKEPRLHPISLAVHLRETAALYGPGRPSETTRTASIVKIGRAHV